MQIDSDSPNVLSFIARLSLEQNLKIYKREKLYIWVQNQYIAKKLFFCQIMFKDGMQLM